jgi:hypothetical protein
MRTVGARARRDDPSAQAAFLAHDTDPIPEMSTWAVMLAGLIFLGWKAKRRKRVGRLDRDAL